MTKNLQSLLLPLVLVLTGAIVLAAADFGLLSLDRIKDLWPAAIILVALADLLPGDRRSNGASHE